MLNYRAFAGTFIYVFRRGGNGGYVPHVATGVFLDNRDEQQQRLAVFARGEPDQGHRPAADRLHHPANHAVGDRLQYAFAGCLVILAPHGIALTPGWGWAILGLLLIVAVTPAAVKIFAFLGAFLPDSQDIGHNVMRIRMFLTPVYWVYEGTGGVRHAFYYWNPFPYFIEILLVPVMTGELLLRSLLFCTAIGIVA